MNAPPSSTPSRRSPTRTRPTGAAARAASGLTARDVVPLLLVMVALGMRILASPALRDPADRAAAQRATCMLLALCLRIAFRQGLSVGRALLAVLRGTVLENKGSLLRKVAIGKASPEALPALDAPGAGRIANALERYLRRTLRVGATRSQANARRVSASPRGRARTPSLARDRARGPGTKEAPREQPAHEKRALPTRLWRALIVTI